MMTMKFATSEPSPGPGSSKPECCMCGDCGLSYELFRCTVCQFRSQHRYCSNMYPKADLYKVCNWCLSKNIDEENKSNNSSNSSSSIKINSEEESKGTTNNLLRRKISGGILRRSASGGSLKLQVKVNQNGSNNMIPIKKQVTISTNTNNGSNSSSPERSPTTGRKRIITRAKLEEMKLRRTRSEDISRTSNININKIKINNNSNSNNGSIHKHVFRNKVRRYKLLDEVSS